MKTTRMIILMFVLIGAVEVFGQTDDKPKDIKIQTSKSTLTLTPVERLRSEASLKSAGRTAEIAMAELTPDVAALVKEEEVLQKDVATYDAAKKSEQAALDVMLQKYNVRLANYNKINIPLTARINANNSLPPDKRNPGTVSQLAAERAAIQPEYQNLQNEKARYEQAAKDVDARLMVIYDPLIKRFNAWNDLKLPKLGLAYRQLKQCAEYAAQINEILKKRFSKGSRPEAAHPGYNPNGKYPVLDGVLEQLKALSNRGFDTP